MDPYVQLARRAVESWVKLGKKIDPPAGLPKEMFQRKAGVFVSIHTKSGELRGLPRRRAPRERQAGSLRHEESVLRGCIGTFLPTKKNIAEEIIANAIAAVSEDPRFPPVAKEELEDLVYSVDILLPPKSVPNDFPLDPKKYGLIVSAKDACFVSRAKRGIYGGRRGLLLPDIPTVDTPEQQIEICKMKAGIGQNEPVSFQVFTVERHGEHN